MLNIHYMYVSLLFLLQFEGDVLKYKKPNQLEEVDQHVEEAPHVTQTQSEHGYVSLVMMMSIWNDIL